ncbi:carbohydrate ABC transporter permease, partial [Streptomyces sp. NPDC001919]
MSSSATRTRARTGAAAPPPGSPAPRSLAGRAAARAPGGAVPVVGGGNRGILERPTVGLMRSSRRATTDIA